MITADRAYVKLKFYGTWTNLSPYPTTGYSATFRGNNPYDPVYAIGGGTCTGYNTYAALYKKCTVMGSKISITALNSKSSANGTTPTLLLVYASDNATAVTPNNYDFHENPMVRYTNVYQSLQIGRNVRRLKCYHSTAKVLNIKKVLEDPDMAINTADGSGIQYPWFWHVIAIDPDNNAGQFVLKYQVLITYYCMFGDRNIPFVVDS